MMFVFGALCGALLMPNSSGNVALTASDVGALPLTGGELSGNLHIAKASFPAIGLRETSGGTALCAIMLDTTQKQTIIRERHPDAPNYYEDYKLPAPDSDRTANGAYAILTTKPSTSIYTRSCPGVDLTTNPSAQVNNDVIRFYDVNSKGFGYIGGTQYTNGQTNVAVSAYRTINGTTIYNALSLGIKPDGTRVVAFTDKTPWLEALGLIYKAGDTYGESSSILTGMIRNGAKQFAMRVTTPKSMASVSGITVTALTGWIGGINGIIGGSGDNTNWLSMEGATVRAVKKSDNTVLIIVDMSSVLTNATNGPASFYGAFTLTFS